MTTVNLNTRIKHFGMGCLPFAVSLITYCILAPFVLVLAVYNLAVILIVKYFRPNWKPTDGNYDAFYTIEKQGILNIIVCLTIDKEISAERICEMFQDRVLGLKNKYGERRYKKLSQYYTHFMGYTFWTTDSKFNIKNHVRNYDYDLTHQIPSPRNETSLQIVLPQLTKVLWKENQSHWEALVVSQYCQGIHQEGISNKTLLIFRFDHGLCDGYSFIGLFQNLFQSPFLTPAISKNKTILSPWQKFRVILTVPFTMVQLVCALLKSKQFAVHPFSTTICDISQKNKISKIKEIKAKFDVDFSTVMHSATLAAISDAMNARIKNAPDFVSGVSVFPIVGHPGGLCNHWTTALTEFPCKPQASSERLQQNEKILNCIKKSHGPIANIYSVRLISLLPVSIRRRFLFALYCLGPTFAITNTPCTLTKEFVDGGEILDGFVAVNPICGVGMVISSWGVNNQQTVVFSVTENIFGAKLSSGCLSSAFMEELEALRKAE